MRPESPRDNAPPLPETGLTRLVSGESVTGGGKERLGSPHEDEGDEEVRLQFPRGPDLLGIY